METNRIKIYKFIFPDKFSNNGKPAYPSYELDGVIILGTRGYYGICEDCRNKKVFCKPWHHFDFFIDKLLGI